jgi:hypothetical protein
MWSCHIEICSGFVLVKMGYHKFNHHHAKHARENEYLISRYKIRKKFILLLRIQKKTSYIHILTRHVEKFSGFIKITIQFHKISNCNAKHVVVRGLNRVYIHNQKFKVILFLKIEEKFCFIWTIQFENCMGFILINIGFHKFLTTSCKSCVIIPESYF